MTVVPARAAVGFAEGITRFATDPLRDAVS